mgnify:CR=1 FL=1
MAVPFQIGKHCTFTGGCQRIAALEQKLARETWRPEPEEEDIDLLLDFPSIMDTPLEETAQELEAAAQEAKRRAEEAIANKSAEFEYAKAQAELAEATRLSILRSRLLRRTGAQCFGGHHPSLFLFRSRWPGGQPASR